MSTGVLYEWDGNAFKQLLWNLFGALSITAWVTLTTAPMFFGLKFAGLLRVSERTEEIGLDKREHGEVAYPFASYIGSELFVETKWGRRSTVSAPGPIPIVPNPPKPTLDSEISSSHSDSNSNAHPEYKGNGNDLI